ncbi:chromate efflux transporter [Rhodovulum visakhapatnamense]|uniref:Chromate transporter n=1 Tax=Rhodovulum visakhapatnamense TaxID=364297 RepID=A0A4V3GT69_9RHOB|nr:chromate efflux transporter [Rhodovulum visakhapatnamense]TDX25573.1 chromate transporter [Rhodovulum visakhapatnamense]
MTKTTPPGRGSAAEVFAVFLRLGLTSFGGPIAHLGYFREEFVARRGWLGDAAYADLVALCQFLPGPASSQVGFALGLRRAGWAGALAAFAGFTLPSALILFGFAMTAAHVSGPLGQGALDGLKTVAVAIVAQAVWGMSRTLCPDRSRAAIALGAVAVLAALPGAGGMVAAIALGALAGLGLGRGAPGTGIPVSGRVTPRQGATALALFAGLLCGLPLLAGLAQPLAVADSFYRAGALVFGGGHVVLPLLEAGTVAPGWVGHDAFLAGYGAAQAVPGPLFTFAAYLGAVLGPAPNGLVGATLALAALFLPGFLILIGVLPFWDALRRRTRAQSAMQGANAAVVGVLGAALYDPLFTGGITDLRHFALGLAGFLALTLWRAPSWAVVLLGAAGGAALALAG